MKAISIKLPTKIEERERIVNSKTIKLPPKVENLFQEIAHIKIIRNVLRKRFHDLLVGIKFFIK